MTEMNEKCVWTIDVLLAIASTLTIYGLLYYVTEDRRIEMSKTIETEYITRPVPEEPFYEPFELEAVNKYYELKNAWQDIEITYQTIELHYLGKYFVTAYASAELGGSTATSSGATCHYSEDNRIPTTCAIDRNLHKFGEILSIEGKLYVTEDTGSGVKGAWVDCYVPDMESVWSWDTGYKSVYSVSYQYHKYERKVHYIDYFNIYLLCSDIRSRSVLGSVY